MRGKIKALTAKTQKGQCCITPVGFITPSPLGRADSAIGAGGRGRKPIPFKQQNNSLNFSLDKKRFYFE